MTSAEFWGTMIRAERKAGHWQHADDFVDWLHGNGSEHNIMLREFEAGYCIHIFLDRSILCCNGEVLTLDEAIKLAGDAISLANLVKCWLSEPEAVQ